MIKPVNYHCKMCGEIFKPKKRDRQTFCSRDCCFQYRHKISEKRKDDEKINRTILCKSCDKWFPAWRKQKYCSKECAYKVILQRAKEDSKKNGTANWKPSSHECKYCHREFIPKYGDKHRLFCSEKCSRKVARADDKTNRRSRKLNAFVKRVYKIKIYERDEWMCKLCGEPVDPRIEYPNLLSASLDHIVPLANGGTHEPNNVQLAHFICNSRKGNRLPNKYIVIPGAIKMFIRGVPNRRGRQTREIIPDKAERV